MQEVSNSIASQADAIQSAVTKQLETLKTLEHARHKLQEDKKQKSLEALLALYTSLADSVKVFEEFDTALLGDRFSFWKPSCNTAVELTKFKNTLSHTPQHLQRCAENLQQVSQNVLQAGQDYSLKLKEFQNSQLQSSSQNLQEINTKIDNELANLSSKASGLQREAEDKQRQVSGLQSNASSLDTRRHEKQLDSGKAALKAVGFGVLGLVAIPFSAGAATPLILAEFGFLAKAVVDDKRAEKMKKERESLETRIDSIKTSINTINQSTATLTTTKHKVAAAKSKMTQANCTVTNLLKSSYEIEKSCIEDQHKNINAVLHACELMLTASELELQDSHRAFLKGLSDIHQFLEALVSSNDNQKLLNCELRLSTIRTGLTIRLEKVSKNEPKIRLLLESKPEQNFPLNLQAGTDGRDTHDGQTAKSSELVKSAPAARRGKIFGTSQTAPEVSKPLPQRSQQNNASAFTSYASKEPVHSQIGMYVGFWWLCIILILIRMLRKSND